MTKRLLALTVSAAATALLLTAGAAQAQKVNKEVEIMNYFGCHKGLYMYLDGGITSHKTDNTIHPYSEKHWGGQYRAGFQYFYQKHLGISAGVVYNKTSIDSMALSGYSQHLKYAVDELSRPYEHHTYFGSMSESAAIHSLSVPAMLLYQTNLGISWKMYLGAGAMMTFYPKSTFSTRDSLETRAYYEEWDLEVGGIGHNTYKEAGFSGKYQFNPNLSLMGEIGLLYAINPRLDAYLCASGYYRMTPMPEKSGSLIYDPDCMSADAYQHPVYQGILSSEASPKIASLSVGLQLGLRYRISGDAKLNTEEYERHRQAHQMMDSDIKRARRVDFDKMEHRRHAQEQDSLELVEEERRRHQMRDGEVERQRRIQDSLQNLLQQDTPPIVVEDNTKPEPERISTEESQELDRLITEINNNSFAFNNVDMESNRRMRANLDRLAEIMTQHPDVHLTIVGHTCDIGTMEQNKIVGMRRAESFRDQLLQRGVQPGQMECQTKWFSEPLVPNTSERNRAINRRVQLIKVILGS